MNFRIDTPNTGDTLRISVEKIGIWEARVDGLFFSLENGMEELTLSNGIIMRRPSDLQNWKMWRREAETFSMAASHEVSKLEVISG